MTNITQDDIRAGQAFYTPLGLKIYNLLVLSFSNRFAWRCPTKLQLDRYKQYVSARHLDIGIGTGYYLDNCNFPSNSYLALLDLNPSCLTFCSEKLSRYKPTLYCANVFDKLSNHVPEQFDSIAINYLLHCLPGNMSDKATVIKNIRDLLNPGGIMFGSTILGNGSKHNYIARKLLKLYNKKRAFSNCDDSLESLKNALKANFDNVEIKQVGSVALFNCS